MQKITERKYICQFKVILRRGNPLEYVAKNGPIKIKSKFFLLMWENISIPNRSFKSMN